MLKQKARHRSDVVKSNTFTVVVVASWCHYSKDLLNEIAKGTSEVKPDLILFKESEVDDIELSLIRRASGEKEISEIKQWAQERRDTNQLLLDPAAVEHKLQYYFVPNSQLGPVDRFPTVLSCNARTCTKMSLRDRLNLLLQQGGMEPLGKR